jgi:hypothetical protein
MKARYPVTVTGYNGRGPAGPARCNRCGRFRLRRALRPEITRFRIAASLGNASNHARHGLLRHVKLGADRFLRAALAVHLPDQPVAARHGRTRA